MQCYSLNNNQLTRLPGIDEPLHNFASARPCQRVGGLPVFVTEVHIGAALDEEIEIIFCAIAPNGGVNRKP